MTMMHDGVLIIRTYQNNHNILLMNHIVCYLFVFLLSSYFHISNMVNVKKILSVKSISTSMRALTREYELSLQEQTKKDVIGVDEAGRGPLAGPVVAGACYIPKHLTVDMIDVAIHDSKQLTEEQREAAFEKLTNHPEIVHAVSVVSHIDIDRMNILQATLHAMTEATHSVVRQLETANKKGVKPTKKQNTNDSNLFPVDKHIALIDGNKAPSGLLIESRPIIQGDGKVYSIAAASIIAKVTRDRLMFELDKKYPQYKFAQHKGYPTAEHRGLLMHYGPCPEHRLSYGPVKKALEAKQMNETKANMLAPSAKVSKESKKRKVGEIDTLSAQKKKPAGNRSATKTSDDNIAPSEENTGLRRSRRIQGKDIEEK